MIKEDKCANCQEMLDENEDIVWGHDGSTPYCSPECREGAEDTYD